MLMSLRRILSPALALLALIPGLSAAAVPQPVLVKNIRTGAAETSFNPKMQVALGNRALFTGDDAVHGEELWISDGTAAGTHLVKDIWPSLNGASITGMTVTGNRAFFSAHDGVHGAELWVTDGTAAGTRMVVDLVPGEAGSAPDQLGAYGEGVLFISDQEVSGRIFVHYSDGTAEGTKKIGDAPASSNRKGRRIWSDGIQAWVFLPDSENTREELWKVHGNGTPLGLVQHASLPTGVDATPLGVLGGNFLFQVFTPVSSPLLSYQVSLWKSGFGGTAKIKSMRVVSFSELSSDPEKVVFTLGKAYFISGKTTFTARQLWVTDGTAAGTQSVSPAALPTGSEVYDLALLGQKLIAIFDHQHLDPVRYLWSFNVQTQAEEVLLDTVVSSSGQSLSYLTVLGDQVLFREFAKLDQIRDAYRLWTTDGTAAGTRYVSPDLSPGGDASWEVFEGAALPAVVTGGHAFFAAGNDTSGFELWKTDGTADGTGLVIDIDHPDGGSSPQQLRSLGGLLYFTADDGSHGRELWRTDGTDEGTFLLGDIHPGTAGSEPLHLVEMNGLVYFTATDPEHGRELWRSDGTPEGTFLVVDATPGTGSGVSGATLFFKDRLFFMKAGNGQTRLWSTDGTAEGTQSYADASQTNLSNPKILTVMDGWLYLTAINTTLLKSVFLRTDGISETLQAANDTTYSFPSFIDHFLVRPPVSGAAVAPDQHVLFFAEEGFLRRCQNNGLSVGIDSGYGRIEDMRLHGDGVLLIRDRDRYWDNLWRNNGTDGSTARWGPEGRISLHHSTPEKIYYSQTTETIPDGGWTVYIHHSLNCMNLDGSGQQVLIPAEFLPGRREQDRSVRIQTLYAEGETVYFARSVDRSLWALGRTLGTPETTRILSTLPLSTNTNALPTDTVQKLGSRLFFAANEGPWGDELYSLDIGGQIDAVEVLAGGQTRPLTADTLTVDLTAVGQSRTRTLRVRNEGALPLTDVALALPEGSDFAVSTTTIGTLAPWSGADVVITFSPTASGVRDADLLITATGSTALTSTVHLTGRGLGAEDLPVTGAALPPRLALIGQVLFFEPDILTATPFTSAVWRRDSTILGLGPVLVHQLQKLTDAGLYRLTVANAAGSVTTAPAVIGVITPAPADLTVAEWTPLTLTCSAKAPKGYKLDYRWRYNGGPLSDSNVRKGSRSAVLKLALVEAADAGNYDCLVTLTTADGPVLIGDTPVGLSAGLTNVSIAPRPRVLPPAQPLIWVIGEAVSYQVQTDLPATAITVKGLPPGLKMSRTGLITGKPTRSLNSDSNGTFLPYQVTLTASNASGPGPAHIMPMVVRHFYPAGNYDALIDTFMDANGHDTYGSHLKLTVSSTAALSGQLLHRGKTYRFSSGQIVMNPDDQPDRFATVSFPSSRDSPPLWLYFTKWLDLPGVELAESEEGIGIGSPVTPFRKHCFSAARPATGYTGTYTVRLNPAVDPALPQGPGYVTATVSKTGLATWKGKLPDGTAIIGSNHLASLQPEVTFEPISLPVHLDLYKLTGCLHGPMELSSPDDLATIGMSVEGLLEWRKDPLPATSKERNYKDGIPMNYLELIGTFYTPPAKGEFLLPVQDGDSNAVITVTSEAVSESPLTQTFTLTSAHKAVLVKSDTPVKTLTFTPATGVFKGSLLFPHPTDAKLNRTSTFEGIFDRISDGLAVGFFLLPELPAPATDDTPATTLKTSPLSSGSIEIRAAD